MKCKYCWEEMREGGFKKCNRSPVGFCIPEGF